MRATIALLLLTLAACSKPLEGQVASQLAEAGLPQPMAACMAGRWVERLSVLQLQEISALAADLKDQTGTLTVGGFAARVRQLDDPEIVQVVTQSTVVCALTS